MREVPLLGGPVEIRGALALERRTTGIMPRRLPAWTREQYPDAVMDFTTTTPSGVRLAFRTEATVLELGLRTLTRPQGEPVLAGRVDLRLDGRTAAHADVPAGGGSVEFAGLPGRLKEAELWLPQRTPCELVALRANATVRPPAPHARRRWVHYGSSISQCLEADSPTGTWPVVAATRAGVEVVNLGFAGNAMLDPFVARTIRDLDADLISLKVGANIAARGEFTPRTFGPAVDGFLDTIREGHPRAPLLVISPIIRPEIEGVPDPDPGDGFPVPGIDVPPAELTMPRLRRTLAEVVRRRAGRDRHLRFLDGRELFGAADVVDLPDGTHPNAAGYRRIGERFAAKAFADDGPFH